MRQPILPPTTECKCSQCRAMCMISPCIPRPTQIPALIEKHGIDKFKLFIVYDQAKRKARHVVAPASIEYVHQGSTFNQCVFFEEETGLCGIHDEKPMEGKFQHHEVNNDLVRSWFYNKFWKSNDAKQILQQFGANDLSEVAKLKDAQDQINSLLSGD